MKIVNEKRNVTEKATKKVAVVNPAKAELYDTMAGVLVDMFGGEVMLVKKGSARKPDKDGKERSVKTGCEGLLFQYEGATVAFELTFKDPETFKLEDCVVEATYTAEDTEGAE